MNPQRTLILTPVTGRTSLPNKRCTHDSLRILAFTFSERMLRFLKCHFLFGKQSSLSKYLEKDVLWASAKILIIDNIVIIPFSVLDVVCCGVETELRALNMLGKPSAFELSPQANSV